MILTSSLRDENLASNLLQASAGSGNPRDRVVSPACIEILCVAPSHDSRETFCDTEYLDSCVGKIHRNVRSRFFSPLPFVPLAYVLFPIFRTTDAIPSYVFQHNNVSASHSYSAIWFKDSVTKE